MGPPFLDNTKQEKAKERGNIVSDGDPVKRAILNGIRAGFADMTPILTDAA